MCRKTLKKKGECVCACVIVCALTSSSCDRTLVAFPLVYLISAKYCLLCEMLILLCLHCACNLQVFFEEDVDKSKYCGHLYGLGTSYVSNGINSDSGNNSHTPNAVEEGNSGAVWADC